MQGRAGRSTEKAVSETPSVGKREYRTEHHTSWVEGKGRETKNLQVFSTNSSSHHAGWKVRSICGARKPLSSPRHSWQLRVLEAQPKALPAPHEEDAQEDGSNGMRWVNCLPGRICEKKV